MGRYLLRQFLFGLLTVWLVITLTFFMMKAIPGDPFLDEKALPKEIHASLLHHYKLDAPLLEQYVQYVGRVITWDFGPSFKYRHRTINSIIYEGFPVSAFLGLEALLIAFSMGLAIGTVSVFYEGRWQGGAAVTLSTFLVSTPTFLIATLLQYIFALKLGWLPVARWSTWSTTILPALSLAAIPMAQIARLIRANLLEIEQKEYMIVAQAKGLSRWQALVHHGIRNSIFPLLPYLGQLSAHILTGSFIVEKIFSIPGLGQWFVTSVQGRDYTAIMGITVFYSLLLLFFLLVADCIYYLVSPHTWQEKRS